MNLKEIKTLIVGTIKQSFTNKKTLDKFDGSSGTLKYNGVPVNNVPVFVADDSPVGNIISFMGNTAPQDYLICDGTIYNIADYPLLAQHMLDEFGSYNYFGGDGETTFAVPDLRGEFLRGTGTATRDSGSGAEVGVHQPPTEHRLFSINNSGATVAQKTDDYGWSFNHDSFKDYKKKDGYSWIDNSVINGDETSNYHTHYTARPTNTSVLYCIKYQITQNNISKDMVNYSLEEQVIGSWIDGKPIYQKTFVVNKSVSANSSIELGIIEDLDTYIDYEGTASCSDGGPRVLKACMGHVYSQIHAKETMMFWSTYAIIVNTATIRYTKTTDAENSFTPDMLSNISTINTTASDDEVNEVIGGI